MKKRIRLWLWLDESPEDNQARLARLGFHFSLVAFLFVTVFVAVLLLTNPGNFSGMVPAWLPIFILSVSVVLFRIKKLKVGGGFLIGCMWLVSALSILPDGAYSFSFPSFFFIILLAGYIFGLKMMAGVLGITILLETGLAVFHQNGIVAPPIFPPMNSLQVALIQSFVLIINVSLAGLAVYYSRSESRAAMRELAERKQIQKNLEISQRELLEQEKLLESITNNLPGIVYKFIAPEDGSYEVPFIGPQSSAIIGLSPESEGFFNRFLDRIVPEDQTRFLESIREAVAASQPWDFEGTYLKPDGKTMLFHAIASPLSPENPNTYIGIVLDVTEKRQMEYEYQENREELQAIIDNPLVGIVVADENGRIIQYNNTFERFLGLDRKEIEGQFIWELTGRVMNTSQPVKPRIDKVKNDFQSILSGEKKQVPGTSVFPIKTGRGEDILIQQNISLYRTPRGDRIGGILIDVTELENTRKALMDSEAAYRAIFEQSPSEISVSRLSGELLDVNEKFCQVMGLTRAEILGKTTVELGRIDPEQIRMLWEAAGKSGGMVEQQEIQSVANGVERTVLISSRILPFHNQPAALTVITDITSRKQAEEKVLHHMEQINGLRKIDTSIILGSELRNTLNLVLEQAAGSLKVDAACLTLWNEASAVMEPVASLGNIPLEMNHSADRPALHAVQQMKTVINPGSGWMDDGTSRFGIKTSCAAPMIIKGKAIGAIEVYSQNHVALPEPEWIDYLEALAGQAVLAINNSDLLENLRKKNEELLEAYESTISGWAQALEIRDEETFGHSERVLNLSLQVAAAMKMTPEELANFRRGVLLHDIGKIGIPDSILLKPGPLDENEWKIMRKHPEFAYSLLNRIPFLKGALDVPYCHHERWDGSGYPRGLKGEGIPLSARIFAVVDVWDALTSDRPYRKAWTPRQARDYLNENAGILFDSEIIDAFFQILPPMN